MYLFTIFAAILASLAIGLSVYVLAKYHGRGGVFAQEAERKTKLSTTDPSYAPSSYFRKESQISEFETLKELLSRYNLAEKITVLLRTAKLKVSVSVFLLFCVILGALSFLLLRLLISVFFSFLFSLCIACLPLAYLIYVRRRYLAKFSEHLPNALSALSGSIKAGRSLEAAIDVVAHTATPPISEEFDLVRAELKLGVPLEQALQNLYERVHNHELLILITGIAIHQELGGNLSEILENLERTIRERFAMLREIKTLSAQGRYSAWVLMAIPVVLVLLYLRGNPEQFMRFVHSGFGGNILWMVAILNIVGFVWIQRMVRLED